MDIDVDLYTGRVISIIVPGPGRVFSFFGRENEYVIPYECICKVGPDVIIVNVCEERYYVSCNNYMLFVCDVQV